MSSFDRKYTGPMLRKPYKARQAHTLDHMHWDPEDVKYCWTAIRQEQLGLIKKAGDFEKAIKTVISSLPFMQCISIDIKPSFIYNAVGCDPVEYAYHDDIQTVKVSDRMTQLSLKDLHVSAQVVDLKWNYLHSTTFDNIDVDEIQPALAKLQRFELGAPSMACQPQSTWHYTALDKVPKILASAESLNFLKTHQEINTPIPGFWLSTLLDTRIWRSLETLYLVDSEILRPFMIQFFQDHSGTLKHVHFEDMYLCDPHILNWVPFLQDVVSLTHLSSIRFKGTLQAEEQVPIEMTTIVRLNHDVLNSPVMELGQALSYLVCGYKTSGQSVTQETSETPDEHWKLVNWDKVLGVFENFRACSIRD